MDASERLLNTETRFRVRRRAWRAIPVWLIIVGAFGPVQRVAVADDAFSAPLPIPPTLRDTNIEIAAQESLVQIFPSGPPTKMWTYNGMYPGPTIRRPSGLPTHVTFNNLLPEEAGEISIHHHGNHSQSSEDGQPNKYLIPHGGSRTYTYLGMEGGAPERGAFQWYHDHRMGLTCRNVEQGMAGMSILDDGFDSFLGLPTDDEFDVPLMVSTLPFDANNQILDQCPPGRGGIPPFDSILPGKLLVNGALQPHFDVADRKYRFRILNASTAQLLNVQMDNGLTMVQVATESGLLPDATPVCGDAAACPRSSILLGPAERAEIIVDFSGFYGETMVLRSVGRPLETVATRASNAYISDVMRFDVTRHATSDAPAVPAHLRDLPAWTKTVSPVPTKSWEFGPGVNEKAPGTAWVVNGRPYDPDAAPHAQPRLGSQETWALVNHSVTYFGLGAPTHAVHLHAVDWIILSRNGLPPPAWEAGLKETFVLDAGEVLVIAASFADYTGEYMVHCHLLPHEDNAMMASFEVIT